MTERVLAADVSAAALDPDSRGPLPERVRTVVIGAGIVGASVAHHLAELGEGADTLVLDRHSVSAGTTWHAAGLLASARATHVLTGLAADSLALLAGLEERSGVDTGFVRRGCITVARTPERMSELRYAAGIARHHEIAVEELDPAGLARLNPLIDIAGLVGGVHFPDDGTVNPGLAALGVATVAARGGVRFREGVRVSAIATEAGRVTGVHTDRGVVACERVALCAGLWSAELARTAGVRLALHAAEHMWVLTEPIDGVSDTVPYLRDLDGHFYARPYRGALLVGAFEPNGKPRTVASIPPDFAFGEFDADPAHFGVALERARDRIPALRDVAIARWLNAPESFTPDGTMLLGETAEVEGLFVLAGMNSQGILIGPGAGRALAEWMVQGAPTVDVSTLHPARFAPVQAGDRYLFERTRETLGRLYSMHWPRLEAETARGRRRTPVHAATAARGAVFGEFAGWERPLFYAEAPEARRLGYSYDRPSWFETVAAEHRAARERAALFDLSSFAKIAVAGPSALSAVQHVFAGDLDVPPGRVVYTVMLNARGGIEADVTVTRLAEEEFLVIAPTATHARVLGWLRRHAPAGTVITDLTAAYATLSLQGPRSREILAELTEASLELPYGSARTLSVAGVELLALRVSFVGELGFELYPSADTAHYVFEAVTESGAAHGLAPAGYVALDTLRSEKGFVHWGADVGPLDTPLETGLGFTVSRTRTDFIGAPALVEARERPAARRLVPIRLEERHAPLYHDETVRLDGRVVGHVTSGNHGYTLGAAVGLATIDAELAPDGAEVSSNGVLVEVAGREVPARIGRGVLYDPTGARMRG